MLSGVWAPSRKKHRRLPVPLPVLLLVLLLSSALKLPLTVVAEPLLREAVEVEAGVRNSASWRIWEVEGAQGPAQIRAVRDGCTDKRNRDRIYRQEKSEQIDWMLHPWWQHPLCQEGVCAVCRYGCRCGRVGVNTVVGLCVCVSVCTCGSGL